MAISPPSLTRLVAISPHPSFTLLLWQYCHTLALLYFCGDIATFFDKTSGNIATPFIYCDFATVTEKKKNKNKKKFSVKLCGNIATLTFKWIAQKLLSSSFPAGFSQPVPEESSLKPSRRVKLGCGDIATSLVKEGGDIATKVK